MRVELSTRPEDKIGTEEQWDAFDDRLEYVPQSAGPEALAVACSSCIDRPPRRTSTSISSGA